MINYRYVLSTNIQIYKNHYFIILNVDFHSYSIFQIYFIKNYIFLNSIFQKNKTHNSFIKNYTGLLSQCPIRPIRPRDTNILYSY